MTRFPGKNKRHSAPRKTARRRAEEATGSVSATSPDAIRPAIGLEATVELTVPFEWTIQRYDPSLPAVLSTPAMIGMMEMAAAQSVKDALPTGSITVGTRIEVDHLKAVTVGANVRAHARLSAYKGRFLVFETVARSGEDVIGRGRVFRAIVEPARFQSRAEASH
jgi:fluoroacetyl-CoA thioesterase